MRTTGDERFRRHLAGAIALAVVVRCLALRAPVDPMMNPDARSFVDLSRSVQTHGQLAYVDQGAPGQVLRAFRSLLYPIFLAAFDPSRPAGPVAALFVQAGLGLLVVAAMALLARRAWGMNVGVLTAWFGALYWTSIVYERQYASEALFTPLLVAGALAASGPWNAGPLALSGLLFGLAALTRPAGLIAAAALLVVWALATIRSGRRDAIPVRRRMRGILAFALGLGLVLTPALLRNRAILGEPVLLTSGGMNFWIGNGRGDVHDAWEVMSRELPARGEIGMDRWFYQDTWSHGAEILRALPGALVTKARTFATLLASDGWFLPWRVLWPLALAGLLLSWPAAAQHRLLLLVLIGTQVALALATVPWSRYRYPLEPLLWPFAAAGLHALWQRGRSGRVTLALVGLGNAGILAVQRLR